MGSNPPGIGTQALKKLRKWGNVFRQPQERPLNVPENDDESLCVVCMEYEPRFWWSECESEHGGKFPLICHRCCNNLRRRVAQGKSIRGAPAPILPCFICQKRGMLISQTSRGTAGAHMQALKMMPPTITSKTIPNREVELPREESSYQQHKKQPPRDQKQGQRTKDSEVNYLRGKLNNDGTWSGKDDATTDAGSNDETLSVVTSASSRR